MFSCKVKVTEFIQNLNSLLETDTLIFSLCTICLQGQHLSRTMQKHRSRLSLYRLRLSRITAYLEVKIWSLIKQEHVTTGNKILWKRGESGPKGQFLLFSRIFSIYLKFQESNYIFIREMWLFHLFFPEFCKYDISRYGYLEVFQNIPWTAR